MGNDIRTEPEPPVSVTGQEEARREGPVANTAPEKEKEKEKEKEWEKERTVFKEELVAQEALREK